MWALVFFAAGLRDAAPGSLYLNMWRLFLMSACTACSALALDEVARRRIGLPLFATVTLAALVVGFCFLHHNRAGAAPPSWVLVAGLVFAVLAAQVLRRVCRTSETRQWLVLSGLIAAYVVADASIGIATIRADDADWRALTTFHSSLPPRNEVKTCLLISESDVPNRLLLALKSVWPTTVVTLVPRLGPGAQDGPRRAPEAEDGHRRRLEPRQLAAGQPDGGAVGNGPGGQSAVLPAPAVTGVSRPRAAARGRRDERGRRTDAGRRVK